MKRKVTATIQAVVKMKAVVWLDNDGNVEEVVDVVDMDDVEEVTKVIGEIHQHETR